MTYGEMVDWFEENVDIDWLYDAEPAQVRDKISRLFSGKGGNVEVAYAHILGWWVDNFYSGRATQTHISQAQSRIDVYASASASKTRKSLTQHKKSELRSRATHMKRGATIATTKRRYKGMIREAYAGKGDRVHYRYRDARGRIRAKPA